MLCHGTEWLVKESKNCMKIKKTTWVIIGGLGLIAIGAGIYFFIIKPKSRSDKYGNLKLKGTGKDKDITGGMTGGVQTQKAGQSTSIIEPNWENPFDSSYGDDVKKWVAPKNLIILKEQFAKQYATELYNAKGILDDNEQAVKGVFTKKVKDKVHVSNVSSAFWKLYKKDLYDYLSSFLNESEMEEFVHGPVRNLPNYRLI
jgi:hypothetical protein